MTAVAAETVELEVERSSRPVTVIIDEWLKDYTEDADEIVDTELVAAALARFANDAEFLDALAADAVPLLILDRAAKLRHTQRRHVKTWRGSVTRESLEARTRDRFARMFEHVGDGKHRSLMVMNKPQLRFAIEKRRQQVSGEMRTIGFLQDIEKRMPADPKVTVGDRFKDADLDRIWRSHFDAEDTD